MLLLVLLNQLLCLQKMVKHMHLQLTKDDATHMALKVANWLPGVVIWVLPPLPLHKVLSLA